VAELYDQVPVGALVQIIPDRLPKKMEKAKPRQEMSGGVVAVAANVPPQPPPQKTVTKAADVESEPTSEKNLNVEEMRMAGSLAGARQKAKLAANTTAAKVAPRAQRQKTITKVAKVTPQPPPQITADMLAMPPSSSLKHF